MGATCSYSPTPLTFTVISSFQKSISHLHIIIPHKSNPRFFCHTQFPNFRKPIKMNSIMAAPFDDIKIEEGVFDPHNIDPLLVNKLVYDALVFSSLHGLLVGDKAVKRSGSVPGVGMVHVPFALLPMPFPETYYRQACELAPIFNELVDRVSLDGQFLQESLSRTKKVDSFTSRLLDIHSKMLEIGKEEEIRLGLHRSDYMLDEQTKLLLQIELNTISCSSASQGSIVSELHRSLLSQYKQHLGLNLENIPKNTAVSQWAEALAKAWTEYNNPRAVVIIVVQAEERNMYDQHWLLSTLKEKHNIPIIRKTLAEVDEQGSLQTNGTLIVDGEAVAVIYFRAGYTPKDYPSESEWKARLLIRDGKSTEPDPHSGGIRPEIVGFVEDKDDISKLRKCFAGLWSLDDTDTVKNAIERPELFVMKPQREGGGNNIYGDDVKDMLLRWQKGVSGEEAAYILMQRIFPAISPTFLIREGIFHKEHTISEIGIYSAYLRNKEKVIVNDECGYLVRTKVSSSNEGGVLPGFGVFDSLYLT